MKVKIERIKIMERIRKEVTMIDELAQDIKKNGLINPVTVMRTDNESYSLLAGLRRLKAVQSLGLTEIAATVMSPADAEAQLNIEISENEQRKAFTISEQAYFGKLLEEIESAKAKERKAEGQSLGGRTAGNGRAKEENSSMDPGPPSNEAEDNLKSTTRDIVGKKLGISGRQYDRVKYVSENAPVEIMEELDKGKRKIRPTYDELKAKDKAKENQPLEESAEPRTDTLPACDLESETSSSKLEMGKRVVAADVADIKVTTSTEKEPTSNKTPSTAKPQNPKPLKEPPESYLSEKDKEAMRKIREFGAMTPEEKITELQRQLKEERARAAGAESDLARLKELHHNEKLHNSANVNNLKMQIASLDAELTVALARIKELEDKYESK